MRGKAGPRVTRPVGSLGVARGRPLKRPGVAILVAVGLALSAFAPAAPAGATPGPAPSYSILESTGVITPGTVELTDLTFLDDTTTTLLPFAVTFYGTVYPAGSALVVSTNGNIQFTGDDPSIPALVPDCLPVDSPDNDFQAAVFAYLSHLTTGFVIGQGVFTAVLGTAPNREFVIEWRASDLRHASPMNFEVILYEASPVITVIYGDMGETTAGSQAIVGVQETSTGPFTEHLCAVAVSAGNSQGQQLIADGTRLDFIPAGVQTITFGALADVPMAQSPLTVSATASSGLAVTFTASPSSVCAAGGTNGATITLMGPGRCTINADQPGDADYNPAPTVSQSFSVTDSSQGIDASENPGDGNPAAPNMCLTQGMAADPCNTASGAFAHAFEDLTVPGRGIALDLSRAYSSLFAGVNGPFGYGWSFTDGMSLTTDGAGNATVHQENGAQVRFTRGAGGTFTAPPHDVATLTKRADGSLIFARLAREVFIFSPSGQLLSKTDLNGYVTTLSYSSSQLSKVTDPAGRVLSFTWKRGHIVGVKDPAKRKVTFTYDNGGNLASATDVGGGLTTFTYDANHRLLTMTDPRGGVVTNAYDGGGRVVSQTDALGRATTFTYSGDNFSASGGMTTVTDPKGSVTVDAYQSGVRTSVTHGLGTPSAATWRYTYDPASLGIISATDPNGHTTFQTFDSSGNPLTRTDPLGRTTSYTYNALNEVLTVTDPLGSTTTKVYDARGNLLATSAMVGADVATVTYGYGDAAHPGDITSRTDPNGHVSTFAYDRYGDLTRATDPLGHATTLAFDVVGRLTSRKSPNGGKTSYAYNAFGDLLTTTDPLGRKTTNRYDADRNLVAVVDPIGNVTTNSYDADNELTKSVHADAHRHVLQVLGTTYDANGNVLKQVNGLGVATETYTYDQLDRVSSAADGLLRATVYTYDRVGNLLTLVDPSGRTTRYSYDAADQVSNISYSDATTPGVAYAYDADGRRTTMTDGTGTSTYAYNALDYLTDSAQGDGQHVSYGYDLAGNVTKITYPDGHTITRTYDRADRLVSVATWLAAPNTVTFAYDADDNLTRESYPNGVSATFKYDKSDRLSSITDVKGRTTLLSLDYTRDGNGLVTKENKRRFGYDALSRLTSDSLATTRFTYDAVDRLTNVTASGAATAIAYDNADQLASSTAPAGPTTYGFDSQGNRTAATPAAGPSAAFTYDQVNRLIGFSRGATINSYTYDGDGLRMSKTVGSVVEPFAWNLAENLPLLLADYGTDYVTGPGGLPLEQITPGGAATYFHQDQLGSTRMLTDAAGAVTGTYTYTAFGRVAAASGSSSQPLGFAGQYTDAESGLIYLRARYYDPVSAQFITRDPVVALTRSAYGYAAGDPVNATDPSGLCDWATAKETGKEYWATAKETGKEYWATVKETVKKWGPRTLEVLVTAWEFVSDPLVWTAKKVSAWWVENVVAPTIRERSNKWERRDEIQRLQQELNK